MPVKKADEKADTNVLVLTRAYTLAVRDMDDRPWEFVVKSWANGSEQRRVYVLEQASLFLRSNHLHEGDIIGICCDEAGNLRVAANTQQLQEAVARPTYGITFAKPLAAAPSQLPCRRTGSHSSVYRRTCICSNNSRSHELMRLTAEVHQEQAGKELESAIAAQAWKLLAAGKSATLTPGQVGRCSRGPFCEKLPSHPGFCSGPHERKQSSGGHRGAGGSPPGLRSWPGSLATAADRPRALGSLPLSEDDIASGQVCLPASAVQTSPDLWAAKTLTVKVCAPAHSISEYTVRGRLQLTSQIWSELGEWSYKQWGHIVSCQMQDEAEQVWSATLTHATAEHAALLGNLGEFLEQFAVNSGDRLLVCQQDDGAWLLQVEQANNAARLCPAPASHMHIAKPACFPNKPD